MVLLDQPIGLILVKIIMNNVNFDYMIRNVFYRAPTWTIEQRNMVGARIKITWEEQLVDPPNESIYMCFTYL